MTSDHPPDPIPEAAEASISPWHGRFGLLLLVPLFSGVWYLLLVYAALVVASSFGWSTGSDFALGMLVLFIGISSLVLGWATARKLSAVFIGFWQRRGLVLKVLLIGGGLFSCLGVLVSAVLLTLMSGFFFVLNAPQVEMEYVTANCDKFTAGGLALETPLSWVARDWDNCEAYGWRGRESHNGDHFAHIGSAANAEVYEAASEPEEQGYWVWGEGRPYLGLCRLAREHSAESGSGVGDMGCGPPPPADHEVTRFTRIRIDPPADAPEYWPWTREAMKQWRRRDCPDWVTDGIESCFTCRPASVDVESSTERFFVGFDKDCQRVEVLAGQHVDLEMVSKSLRARSDK